MEVGMLVIRFLIENWLETYEEILHALNQKDKTLLSLYMLHGIL